MSFICAGQTILTGQFVKLYSHLAMFLHYLADYISGIMIEFSLMKC